MQTQPSDAMSTADTQPPTPALTSRPAARASGLTKIYGQGETAVTALRSIDVEFARGAFTAIMGPSGSGKSTLMHCMAGLDAATSGSVFIGPADLTKLNDSEPGEALFGPFARRERAKRGLPAPEEEWRA